MIRAALVFLALTSGWAGAQIGLTLPTIEALVADADLVVRGSVIAAKPRGESGQRTWLDVTLEVNDSLKGPALKQVTFALETLTGDKRWEQFIAAKQDQLWFLLKSDRPVAGEDPKATKRHARHTYKPAPSWPRLRLGPEVDDESSFTRPPPPIFTMNLDVVAARKEVLAATVAAIATQPEKRTLRYTFAIPRALAQRTGSSGDANSLVVSADARLETMAHRMIDSPGKFLPNPDDWNAKTEAERKRHESWIEFSANSLRAEGALALSFFKSEANIERLVPLLEHPATVGIAGVGEKEYFVRKAAYETLRNWKVEVEKPVLIEGRDARHPADDDEFRSWLQNMVWHHRYANYEITAATGMEKEEIEEALERFNIYWNTKPERPADASLLVLPYPGGRHPRIGFLDGAVTPQRDTKISIFTPWNDESYVVADIPEAIWSNLGLTYLAHTHVPTIWTEEHITLKPLEWNRRDDGTLDMERVLPNGIAFGTRVIPGKDAVCMEMWLKNGTAKTLTGLRVQNCIMLKGAAGFTTQSNDNKVLRTPYAAVHDETKKRWIITAWDPCHRPWANPKCPCLHSDPKFPDCAPGETMKLRGWLSFYEGEKIEEEFARIEETGWRKAEFNR